jgi:hypothetical protein
MAIGTILWAARRCRSSAALTSLAAVKACTLDSGDRLVERAATAGLLADPCRRSRCWLSSRFSSIVCVTGSVSDCLKQRNEELRLTSEALGERSAELQRTRDEIEELGGESRTTCASRPTSSDRRSAPSAPRSTSWREATWTCRPNARNA